MLSIGLNKSQEEDYQELLRSAHNIKIVVRLLDLDHNYKRDLTPNFIGGQVNIDSKAEVTRSLDLTLFDPAGKISIDPDEPSRTSIFIADMISVIYVIQNPQRTKEYRVPVFCGPIDDVSRDDVYIDVKCLGKESLSLTNLWIAKTYKKTQERTHVIRSILTGLVGETKLSIDHRDAKLPNDQKLTREDKPWSVAKKLAGSMSMQLFYDGRGYAVLRKRGRAVAYVFKGNNISSEPEVSYDLSETVNAVDVIGGKPSKKAKKKVKYRAIAPRNHSLSPWRLGRGGVPRYLWLEINDDSIKSKKEAKEIATRNLRRGLQAGVEAAWDGLPNPRLEEDDLVRIQTDEVSISIRLSKFTIPLVAGENASYGYLRRIQPKGGPRPMKRKKRKRNKDGKNK